MKEVFSYQSWVVLWRKVLFFTAPTHGKEPALVGICIAGNWARLLLY